MQKTSYIINNDKKDRFRPSSQLLEESSELNDEDFGDDISDVETLVSKQKLRKLLKRSSTGAQTDLVAQFKPQRKQAKKPGYLKEKNMRLCRNPAACI